MRGAPPGNTGYFIDGVACPNPVPLCSRPERHPPGRSSITWTSFRAAIRRASAASPAASSPARRRARRASSHGEANIRLFDAGVARRGALRRRHAAACSSAGASATRRCSCRWSRPTRASTTGTTRGAWPIASATATRSRSSPSAPTTRSSIATPTTGAKPRSTRCFAPSSIASTCAGTTARRGGNLRTALTLGIDNSLVGSSSNTSSEVIAETLGLRNEYEERLSPTAKLRLGADAILYHYSVNAQSERLFQSFSTRDDVMFGVRGDVVWRVHPRIEIVPGIRLRHVHVATRAADTRGDAQPRRREGRSRRPGVRSARRVQGHAVEEGRVHLDASASRTSRRARPSRSRGWTWGRSTTASNRRCRRARASS